MVVVLFIAAVLMPLHAAVRQLVCALLLLKGRIYKAHLRVGVNLHRMQGNTRLISQLLPVPVNYVR